VAIIILMSDQEPAIQQDCVEIVKNKGVQAVVPVVQV
jgi:hypothetical protein